MTATDRNRPIDIIEKSSQLAIGPSCGQLRAIGTATATTQLIDIASSCAQLAPQPTCLELRGCAFSLFLGREAHPQQAQLNPEQKVTFPLRGNKGAQGAAL
jgi:hypothetical protein